MSEKNFTCKRLYERLNVRDGRQQFVLTGNITDNFFADVFRGLCRNIKDALLYYAVRQGYEIAFAIDDEMTLHFATPKMRDMYNSIVEGESENPNKAAGAVKRGATNPSVNTSSSGAAADAARRVQANAVGQAQNIFDGILNRLLPSNKKCFVVLLSAENLTEDAKKLETVRNWACAKFGNSQSCSLLIVAPAHFKEFECNSDRLVSGLDIRTVAPTITIGAPDAEEIEAMLFRLSCKYKLSGNTKHIAKGLTTNQSLHNIVSTIKEKMELNPTKLSDIFIDDDAEKRKRALEEANAELDKLHGLKNVKQRVRELMNKAEATTARIEAGEDAGGESFHTLFIGNPGTGKTVVAEILGKYYYALGLRTKPDVVKVEQNEIISKVVGESSEKLQQKVSEAMGGVLFIDEIPQYADDEETK